MQRCIACWWSSSLSDNILPALAHGSSTITYGLWSSTCWVALNWSFTACMNITTSTGKHTLFVDVCQWLTIVPHKKPTPWMGILWCIWDLVLDCRYLSEFLYAWLMSTLSRADSSQMAEERILEEQLKGRSSKKTKKKKKGTLLLSPSSAGFFIYNTNYTVQLKGIENVYLFSMEVLTSHSYWCFVVVYLVVRPLSKEITMSQAYQNMCAGMYKVKHQYGCTLTIFPSYLTHSEV